MQMYIDITRKFFVFSLTLQRKLACLLSKLIQLFDRYIYRDFRSWFSRSLYPLLSPVLLPFDELFSLSLPRRHLEQI